MAQEKFYKYGFHMSPLFITDWHLSKTEDEKQKREAHLW
jgi:hypothetical protein